MSIFSTIIKDTESIASKIEHAFIKIFNAAPAWANIASSTITVLGPVVQSLVALLPHSAAANAEINKIIIEIQTDLVSASQLAKSATSATSVTQLLNGVVANLGQILALVKITNPGNVAQIEKVVGIIVADINVLLQAAPIVAAVVTALGVEAPKDPAAPQA